MADTSNFPPWATEAWTNLAAQLPASTGAFSGPSTQDGGKQWLRQLSLVVYSGEGASFSSTPTTPAPSTTTPSTRDNVVSLPDVNVTAKAPAAQQPLSVAQPAPQTGLELGALRVTFNIHKNTVSSPSLLDARIYNLSAATMDKIKQFNRVQLKAGYQYGQYGVVFDGAVIQYRQGKENPTDTFLDIKGADGHRLPAAVTFRRYEAGIKESQILKDLIADTGIAPGYISPLVGTQTLLRPWIMGGNTQKYLRDLMLKYNANCYPDLNQLHVVSQSEYLPTKQAIVLSPSTGLVGIPEATPEGIQIRALLSPLFQIGGLVQLDNTLISGVAFLPGGQAATYLQKYGNAPGGSSNPGGFPFTVDVPVPTSPIGTYKIYMMEITGDTRGQPWYCDLICLGLDSNGKPMEIPGSVLLRQPQ